MVQLIQATCSKVYNEVGGGENRLSVHKANKLILFYSKQS